MLSTTAMPSLRARIATSLSCFALLAAISACQAPAGDPDYDDAGLPYCWIYDCPGDPGADTCGTCLHQGQDRECAPGFVCSCDLTCVKGPRSYDGGQCPIADAGVDMDAQLYDWPACDDRHIPGT